MSACKTGCGREAMDSNYFCESCNSEWLGSPEQRRYHAAYVNRHKPGQVSCDEVRPTALADFARRVRAERENGGKA